MGGVRKKCKIKVLKQFSWLWADDQQDLGL